MQYKYGCDPEVFIVDRKTKLFVPAYNMIEGDKANPKRVRNGAVQVDGLALEFNIDPAETRQEWFDRVKDVREQLRLMVDPKKYDLVNLPSATFEPEPFFNLPPEARILGCDPDINAWSGDFNVIPNGSGEVPYRCAGGHVHVGWLEPDDVNVDDAVHQEDCRTVVKALDQTLGFLSTTFDKDSKRARLYGNAGAHRVKPYGVEYRSLSNAWLETDARINWVFDTTKLTMEILEKDHKYFDIGPNERYLQSVIRERDTGYYVKDFFNRHLKRLQASGFEMVA